MKFYALNGSPRKNQNTAMILQETLNGVQSVHPDATAELVHLYDFEYKSCISCLECKRIAGKNYGHCVLKDPLAPLLEQFSQADALIFGSPVYFGNITGKMLSFLERLLFAFTSYEKDYRSLAPKRMPTACIYTMNVTEKDMEALQYKEAFSRTEFFIGNTFAQPKTLYVNNTLQLHDYSGYRIESFSEQEKQESRKNQFPIDKQKAFALGAALVKEISVQ